MKSRRKSFSSDLINSTIEVSKEFNATRCFCVHVTTTRKTITGEKKILQEGIMSRDPFQNWKFSYFNIFVCFPAPNVKCGNTRIIFLMFSPTHHNEPFFLLLTHDGDDFWIMRKSMGKCSQAHVFQAIYFNFDSVHQLKAQGEVTQGKARMENSLWLVLNSINFTFNFLSVGLVVVERKTKRIMNVIAFIAFLEFHNFNQVDVWPCFSFITDIIVVAFAKSFFFSVFLYSSEQHSATLEALILLTSYVTTNLMATETFVWQFLHTFCVFLSLKRSF